MPRPPIAHPGANQARSSARRLPALEPLLVADRRKRIDRYIDYFGAGGTLRTIVPSGSRLGSPPRGHGH